MKTRVAVVRSLLVAMTVAQHASAAQSLRFATIAPKSSTWGKVLGAWEKAVRERTQGELDLTVFYNGVQGDEHNFVTKMRVGELDGASLSSVGLSHIHRDVMTLQLPGVTNSWPLADLVRSLLGEPIEKLFRAQGFELLAWGDIGLAYQMTKGVEVKNPLDLRGKHPMVFRNEPMAPLFFSLVGQVVPVPLDVTEVLAALRAGTVNVLGAPALAAEQLQWVPYLDHFNDQVLVAVIGGTVIRADRLEQMSADTRTTFLDTGRRAATLQSERIRTLDAEAKTRLMAKMTVVRPSDEDKVDWYRLFLKAVKRLRNGILSRELVDRVLEITGKS